MTSIWKKKKAKRIAILSIGGVLLISILCFVLGYGLGEGWDSVARWFTSKWATLAVVAIVVVFAVLSYAFCTVKDKETFK